MSLPPELSAAVSDWLARHGGGGRRDGARGLSDTYKAGGSSRGIDLGAYLVARLPATFAAVSRVLAELRARRTEFAPRSLLDAGSGPGTASWATLALWPDIENVTFVDNHPEFLILASALAAQGSAPLAAARQLRSSFAALPRETSADLVIAAYALAELPLASAGEAAAALWSAARQALVLVEPGTPQGFARISAARTMLLKQGAIPAGPCTHADACPVTGADWCHFSVRLARSRAHRHAKGAELPFEDEKFSWLAVTRDGAVSKGARVVAPARHLKHAVTFRLCAQGRLEERSIASRDRELYKSVRHKDWGDWIGPASEEETP